MLKRKTGNAWGELWAGDEINMNTINQTRERINWAEQTNCEERDVERDNV